VRAWLAAEGKPDGSDAELSARPEVRAKMEGELKASLRDLAQFEIPQKALLLTSDFTVESGELTPTLKVKRRVVEQRHRDRIEALYAEAGRGPGH
jgi:long-chain acyl-CoA synthetase